MKKFLAFALVLALALTMTACAVAEDADAVMTHEDYVAAELDAKVTVETYVQAKQSWWDNKATLYTPPTALTSSTTCPAPRKITPSWFPAPRLR